MLPLTKPWPPHHLLMSPWRFVLHHPILPFLIIPSLSHHPLVPREGNILPWWNPFIIPYYNTYHLSLSTTEGSLGDVLHLPSSALRFASHAYRFRELTVWRSLTTYTRHQLSDFLIYLSTLALAIKSLIDGCNFEHLDNSQGSAATAAWQCWVIAFMRCRTAGVLRWIVTRGVNI